MQEGLLGDLRDYLTVSEVAELEGVTPQTVRHWIKSGNLSASKDGRLTLIAVTAMEAFERPTRRKRGRPKGSRNAASVVPLRPDAVGAAKRRIETEYGSGADEISAVCRSLGQGLIEVSDLIEKLNTSAPETSKQELLRADLRASQRMMRRAYDFLVLDGNVTFAAMDARDALVHDLRRELRGT
jgi:excisionase family DNA binding protein